VFTHNSTLNRLWLVITTLYLKWSRRVNEERTQDINKNKGKGKNYLVPKYIMKSCGSGGRIPYICKLAFSEGEWLTSCSVCFVCGKQGFIIHWTWWQRQESLHLLYIQHIVCHFTGLAILTTKECEVSAY
jgi:hypothetical protein